MSGWYWLPWLESYRHCRPLVKVEDIRAPLTVTGLRAVIGIETGLRAVIGTSLRAVNEIETGLNGGAETGGEIEMPIITGGYIEIINPLIVIMHRPQLSLSHRRLLRALVFFSPSSAKGGFGARD